MKKNYLGSDILLRFDVIVDDHLFKPKSAHVKVFGPKISETPVAVGSTTIINSEVSYVLLAKKIKTIGIYTAIFKVDLGDYRGEREHIMKIPVVTPPIKKSLIKELVN